MTHIVKIISFETEEVLKEYPCNSERQADRVDDGLNINLDHEKFFTVIEEVE